MAAEPLSADRILEAAEEVLRRHGPTKANVVDVARALDVSHGSVYRHFESKAALRDAVIERWLAEISEPLREIATSGGPAGERLRRWLDSLVAAKRSRALGDPELFAGYMQIAGEARGVILEHVEQLTGQLERIVADGVAAGELRAADPAAAARAVFDATSRFHNPAHAAEWSNPRIEREYEEVRSLVFAGLMRRRYREPSSAGIRRSA